MLSTLFMATALGYAHRSYKYKKIIGTERRSYKNLALLMTVVCIISMIVIGVVYSAVMMVSLFLFLI
jgi:hypothetical protein